MIKVFMLHSKKDRVAQVTRTYLDDDDSGRRLGGGGTLEGDSVSNSRCHVDRSLDDDRGMVQGLLEAITDLSVIV